MQKYFVYDLTEGKERTIEVNRYCQIDEIVEIKIGNYYHECRIVQNMNDDLKSKCEELIEKYSKELEFSVSYKEGYRECLESVIRDLQNIITNI